MGHICIYAMARTRTSTRSGRSLRRPSAFSAIGNAAAAVAARAAPYAAKAARDYAARTIQSWWLSKSKSKSSGAKRPASVPLVQPMMKRRKFTKMIYRTTGRVGNAFVKPKRKSVNIFLKKGAVTKRESSISLTDADCVYVGHAAASPQLFIDTIFRAWVRKIMALEGIHFNNFEELLPTAISFWVEFRDGLLNSVANTSGSKTSIAAGQTFNTFADGLRNHLVVQTGATDQYMDFLTLHIEYVDSGSTTFTTKTYKISDFYFKVVANSNMQVQNRSAASGAADETSALDISNNPLRGKVYNGVTNICPWRFNNDAVAPTPFIRFTHDTGVCGVQANDANFTAQMSSLVKKPVPRASLRNCLKNSYVQLAPGEIKRSHCTYTWSGNINQLVNRCIIYFKKLNAGTEADAYWPLTKNLFYGLEKLCDAGGEPVISIAAEIVGTTSAVCNYKRHSYCDPFVIT